MSKSADHTVHRKNQVTSENDTARSVSSIDGQHEERDDGRSNETQAFPRVNDGLSSHHKGRSHLQTDTLLNSD